MYNVYLGPVELHEAGEPPALSDPRWTYVGRETGSVGDKLQKALRPGASRDRSVVVFVTVPPDSPLLDQPWEDENFAVALPSGEPRAYWLLSGHAVLVNPRGQKVRAPDPHPAVGGKIIALKMRAAEDRPLFSKIK